MLKNLSKVALLACAVGIGSGSSAQEVASGIIEFSPTEPYPVREVYYPGTEALAEDEMRVIACGTGMPTDMSIERNISQAFVEPRRYFESILEKDRVVSIAFVFGNEKFGMTADDMALCDVMLGIPTNPSFGSLNLASAVQLIAYDWRQALGGF